MQLTTPMEPARAVSTAINTLSNLLQSMEPLPPPSPKREGATYLDEIVLFIGIVFTCLRVVFLGVKELFFRSEGVVFRSEGVFFRSEGV